MPLKTLTPSWSVPRTFPEAVWATGPESWASAVCTPASEKAAAPDTVRPKSRRFIFEPPERFSAASISKRGGQARRGWWWCGGSLGQVGAKAPCGGVLRSDRDAVTTVGGWWRGWPNTPWLRRGADGGGAADSVGVEDAVDA